MLFDLKFVERIKLNHLSNDFQNQNELFSIMIIIIILILIIIIIIIKKKVIRWIVFITIIIITIITFRKRRNTLYFSSNLSFIFPSLFVFTLSFHNNSFVYYYYYYYYYYYFFCLFGEIKVWKLWKETHFFKIIEANVW